MNITATTLSSSTPEVSSHGMVSSTLPSGIVRCSLAQRALLVYQPMLHDNRLRAHTIEIWRDLEDRRLDELTKQKASEYRSLLPIIMQAASAALGIACVGASFIPETAGPSWLPGVLKQSNAGREVFKIGVDILGNYQKASLTEIDAQIEKARKLEERRAKEEQDRRNESHEALSLMQSIGDQVARAIQAMAR